MVEILDSVWNHSHIYCQLKFPALDLMPGCASNDQEKRRDHRGESKSCYQFTRHQCILSVKMWLSEIWNQILSTMSHFPSNVMDSGNRFFVSTFDVCWSPCYGFLSTRGKWWFSDLVCGQMVSAIEFSLLGGQATICELQKTKVLLDAWPIYQLLLKL